MPELPEVETTKNSLTPLLGQHITQINTYQPKLRWQIPDDLDQLTNHTLTQIQRRAKYLILTFSPNPKHPKQQAKQIIIHLGMSGSLQQYPNNTDKRKHDHLILHFCNSNKQQTQLHYHDPRRFGAVLWHHQYQNKLLDHLGVEPLSQHFNADYLYNTIQRQNQPKKRPISKAIKSVIMEQTIVVGVGNIYATESLFLSNIHPATPANTLNIEQITQLVAHIKTILQQAIKQGGSTLKDFSVSDGKTGYFQQTLYAYGRQGKPCTHCQTPLENIKINGRASVFCPKCQPYIPQNA